MLTPLEEFVRLSFCYPSRRADLSLLSLPLLSPSPSRCLRHPSGTSTATLTTPPRTQIHQKIVPSSLPVTNSSVSILPRSLFVSTPSSTRSKTTNESTSPDQSTLLSDPLTFLESLEIPSDNPISCRSPSITRFLLALSTNPTTATPRTRVDDQVLPSGVLVLCFRDKGRRAT